jgi:uncharacterized protein (TIGR03086 family)
VDQIAVYKKAVDQTGRIMANVKPDQMSDPTPCDEWDVRGLVNHTIAVAKAFAAAARGEEFDPTPFGQDNIGVDAAASYHAAAKEIHEALGRPDVLEGTWHMPFGPVPAPGAIGFCTLELFAHGWDTAKATGQAPDFDDEVSEVAMATAQAAPPELVRQPGVFGPENNCADGTPLHDRVASFLGRKL